MPIYCNRGVNGIEGSLSVAAGYSAVSKRQTYAIIGDLSFFYDANALWNSQLHNNLRILLLNDHGGGIFSQLPGLKQSPALTPYVSARHKCNAKGIAQSYNCTYLNATSQEQLTEKLRTFTEFKFSIDNNKTDDKPIILEYDTNMEEN